MSITLTAITLGAVTVLFLAVLYTLYLTAGIQKKLNEITGRAEGKKTASSQLQSGEKPKEHKPEQKNGERDYREANILYVKKSDGTGVQVTGPSGISFEGKDPACRLDIVIEK